MNRIIYNPDQGKVAEEKRKCWETIQDQVKKCNLCPLNKDRNCTVFGEGPWDADLMFVGEGPGADEDRESILLIGRAGQLLTRILEAAGISRDQVFITNVVKCRPPNNRVPMIEEMMACSSYLEAQIAIINPRIIVCLGSTPTKWFLKSTEGISKIRGKWFSWRGIDLMPMFHPSYLLRNQSRKPGSPKDLTWQDIREVKERLEKSASV